MEKELMIVNMYLNGLTWQEIANSIGIDKSSVGRVVTKYGLATLPSRSYYWDAKHDNLLKLLYENQIISLNRLAEILGRTYDSVAHRIKFLGLLKYEITEPDEITSPEMSLATDISKRMIQYYIKRGYLKAEEVKIGNRKRFKAKITDFCEFLNNNKDIWLYRDYDVDFLISIIKESEFADSKELINIIKKARKRSA